MWATHVPRTGVIDVIEWPDPRPQREGEFVVKMLWASVCGSDLHAALEGNIHADGPSQPGYPGHEGVGVVVESRSRRFVEGDVVLTLPLGELGGCFAEYQLLDDLHAIKLPPGADSKPLMMAQQYGTVLFAMKNYWPTEVPPRATGTAVVHGAGSAGLFFVQECRRAGFERVLCSDLNDRRLAIAAELGAEPVKIPERDLTALVAERTHDRGADLVIEAVGTVPLRNQCVEQVRRQGIVGIFGVTVGEEPELWHAHPAFRKCARVSYSVGAQSEEGLASFHEALRRIHAGEVRVDYCLGPEYGLHDVAEALQVAHEQGRGAVKITVVCS